MKTPEIREFNEQDWMLLAGAEPFADGHNPLIIDNFPYVDMIMTADGSGIMVLVDGKEYHLPATNPQLATYDAMSEVFEAVVGCMFMASEFDLDCYISGFGFRDVMAQ